MSRCCPKPPIITQPTLSPDASKLAFALETNGIADISVVDLARHTKTRITFGPQYSGYPIWWPDGKSIVFGYGSSAVGDSLYRQRADGTGSKEKLLETPGIRVIPFSVSPDGRYIPYLRRDPKSNTNTDIWALPMYPDKSGDQKAVSGGGHEFLGRHARFLARRQMAGLCQR